MRFRSRPSLPLRVGQVCLGFYRSRTVVHCCALFLLLGGSCYKRTHDSECLMPVATSGGGSAAYASQLTWCLLVSLCPNYKGETAHLLIGYSYCLWANLVFGCVLVCWCAGVLVCPASEGAGNGYEASLRRLCREGIRDFLG